MSRAFLACLLLLAGCGSGPGPTAGMDQTRAAWQILDLTTGTVTAQASLPTLATDPRYRDQWMAFRLIPRAATAIGQPAGTFARQDDESRTTVRAACYIGAFEVTRAQWRRLSGSIPWATPAVAMVDGTVYDDTLPATGLGPVLVAAALVGWNGGHRAHLAVPSPAQWEVAARGGNAGTYHWGEDHRTSTVRTFAATWETGVIEGAHGPQAVGIRQPNGFGLYDTAGNAWELTSDGRARGGSWADGVALARPANHREVPDDGWATVGVRLIYRP